MMELTYYLSLAFIVGSWIVSHLLTVQRDRKTELRSRAKEFIDEVLEVEARAIQYHTEHIRRQDREAILKIQLERLDIKADILSSKLDKKSNLWIFRSAITMENFGSPNFKCHDLQTDLICSIRAATNRIIFQYYIL